MQLPPERPLALALSFALIRAAAQIVPAQERSRFEYDWQLKLYHRWQFLFHMGLWNSRESFSLIASSTLSISAAVQHFAAQDSVRTRVGKFVQSPLTCLSSLAGVLLVVALFSGGFPATRDLIFRQLDRDNSKLVYVWVHTVRGGGDRPLPAEVIEAWKTHSSAIGGAASFHAVHREVQLKGAPAARQLVVLTEPDFFRVLGVQPVAGSAYNAETSLLLSYNAWVQLFHASLWVIGSTLLVAGNAYPVRGILPQTFEPLSRQTAFYLVLPKYVDDDAYAVLKVRPGVTQRTLEVNLAETAQNATYYFLQGQLRYGFAQSSKWAPVRSFGVAAFASALMLLLVSRIKWKSLWPKAGEGQACVRRSAFFAAKTTLGALCVFTACLEWSRSTSAILFGNFDPASGPFLLWLYILGTMGLFFWVAMDQKARCRQCLQLLGFPVRMGSPGNLLLDWSGIELCCAKGHGVLHVPHLAPSWAEESDHWITLDSSWQSLFSREKR